jgi:hypothetical protein
VTDAVPVAAQAESAITGGAVTQVLVTNGGSGYVVAPAVTLVGATGSGARARATVSGGALSGITVTAAGAGYTAPPQVLIALPPARLLPVTRWSNDGSSTAGTEPQGAVNLQVVNGSYSALLGYTGLPGMAALPLDVLGYTDARVRVWYRAKGKFLRVPTELPLASVPYAEEASYAQAAGTVEDGAITAPKLATSLVTTLAEQITRAQAESTTLFGSSLSFVLEQANDVSFVRGFGNGTPAQELGLRSNNVDNVLYLQNQNSVGFSAMAFRDAQGIEKGAIGYGNPDSYVNLPYRDTMYLEVTGSLLNNNVGVAPRFVLAHTTSYSDQSTGFGGHQRFTMEPDGTMIFWRYDSTSQNQGTPLVTIKRDEPIVTLGGHGFDHTSLYGELRGFDENHAISFRDRNINATSIYEFGGPLSAGTGFKVYTGGARVNQQLRWHVADDRSRVSNVFSLRPQVRPTNPEKGDCYCDDTDGHFYGYNGTVWKQLDN